MVKRQTVHIFHERCTLIGHRFKKEYDKALMKLNELESLFKAREKMIKSANRIVQGLKLVVKERKEACEVHCCFPSFCAVRVIKISMLDKHLRLLNTPFCLQ